MQSKYKQVKRYLLYHNMVCNQTQVIKWWTIKYKIMEIGRLINMIKLQGSKIRHTPTDQQDRLFIWENNACV